MRRLDLLVLTVVMFHCWGVGDALRPNIVLLMVDDMGIGDIPCYGNTSIPMPNVAQLCKQGARLTHHTTPAVFCSPSRTAFMTGRYQVRSGMVGDDSSHGGSPPVVLYAAGTVGLPKNESTFATVLKKANYTTGLVGKWHLGLNSHIWGDMEHGPLGHGFDYFYGLPLSLIYTYEDDLPIFEFCKARILEVLVPMLAILPLRYYLTKRAFLALVILTVISSMGQAEYVRLSEKNWWQQAVYLEKFLNSFLMENEIVVEKPIQLASLSEKLTNKSLEFIERSSKLGQPFLLFHSFAAVHTPLIPSQNFQGRSEHGAYGDKLMELDHAVGRILEKLRELGLEGNTVVYFTSDHGADIQIGQDGGFNGPFRGGKANAALEGGMRIPGILKWPGVIQEGLNIATPTSLMDILPTLAHIAGLATSNSKLDGQSLLPHLLGDQVGLENNRVLYHFCQSQIFAVRAKQESATYKLILKSHPLDSQGHCGSCNCYGSDVIEHDPPILFNIDTDPGEVEPLNPASTEYNHITTIIAKHLKTFQEDLSKTKMAAQFSSYAVLPRPWIQPLLNVG